MHSGLSMHSRLSPLQALARIMLTKKPKGTLSAKVRTNRKVSVISKLFSAYIRRRKQKEKTHSHTTHTQGLSLRENPLSLVISLFLVISHPSPSSINPLTCKIFYGYERLNLFCWESARGQTLII